MREAHRGRIAANDRLFGRTGASFDRVGSRYGGSRHPEQLGLCRFELRLRGLHLLLGLIVLSTRGKSLAQELALPTLGILRIRQHGLGRSQIGFRRPQRVLIILGFNFRNDLAGCNGVANIDVSFPDATTDPERQIDLILGLDLTGQADRLAAGRVSDRGRTHRSDFDLLGLVPCRRRRAAA